MTVPIFVALFFAEFTAHPIAHWIADLVISAVAALLYRGFRFIDALMAAWLQVFLLFFAGVFFVLEEIAADAAPVVTENEFLITVFVFEFVAGTVLVYDLYQATRVEDQWWNSWLVGIGIILFVSGWLATLVRFNASQVGEAVLLSGFMASTLGLALGVTAMILLVRPDFDGDSVIIQLQETDVWDVFREPEADTDEQDRKTLAESRK